MGRVLDPSSNDPLLRVLAFVHPVWMTATIGLAWIALRAGIEMKRRRGQGLPGVRALREKHLRIGKLAIGFALVGFLGGPLSAWLTRGMEPFQTFHSWLGLGALVLFVAAAQQGRQLESGVGRVRSRHGWLGLAAFLVAAVTSVAGFVLLP